MGTGIPVRAQRVIITIIPIIKTKPNTKDDVVLVFKLIFYSMQALTD